MVTVWVIVLLSKSLFTALVSEGNSDLHIAQYIASGRASYPQFSQIFTFFPKPSMLPTSSGCHSSVIIELQANLEAIVCIL
jgi:hypothetical protein